MFKSKVGPGEYGVAPSKIRLSAWFENQQLKFQLFIKSEHQFFRWWITRNYFNYIQDLLLHYKCNKLIMWNTVFSGIV